MLGSLLKNLPSPRPAARIAFVYALFGGLWIIGSDTVLWQVVQDGDRMAELQTIKGWFFIAITSFMLYLLVRGAVRTIERTTADVRQREAELANALDDMAMFKFMVDGAGEEVYLVDADSRFVYVNAAAARSIGYTIEELLGLSVPDINPEFDLAHWRSHFATLATADMPAFETPHRRKDGSLVVKEVKSVWMTIANRPYVAGFARDVTERRRLEQELRQSQKMEAIGRLAGGIAHDFNNLLSVITGYGELAAADLKPEDPRRQDLEQVLRAAERAVGLTRQLLAFSRKQVVEPRILDLNALMLDMGKMLTRVIGEDVTLVLQPGGDVGRIYADPGQIEQALLNLVVNARDAMAEGGKLLIATGNCNLQPGVGRRFGALHEGPCVCLTVSDTGTGMDEAVLAHLFEPFFTTKAHGKGTGLGLSTVYGVMQQVGGSIEVDSQPGHGTRFHLYFPCVEGDLPSPLSVAKASAAVGHETVLLVEDEPLVRGLFRQYLSERAYIVLEAGNAAEALAIAAAHGGRIDLLVTDVVIPGMSGVQLAARLQTTQPGLLVLYVSGYADSASHAEIVRNQAAYLQKPVAREALLAKVRQLLDAASKDRA